VYGVGAQVRVSLTHTIGLAADYYYYHHQYSNPAELSQGFPATYDRNAVRVGITFLMPVVRPPAARAGSVAPQ
jgi:hypothetical protein